MWFQKQWTMMKRHILQCLIDQTAGPNAERLVDAIIVDPMATAVMQTDVELVLGTWCKFWRVVSFVGYWVWVTLTKYESYCLPHYSWTMNSKHDQIKLIKTRGERGMKCIVSDTLRNDLRLETKLSSACRDIHKVLTIDFLRTSGEFLMHSFFIKMHKN